MELATGALQSVIPKLGDLLAEDYNLRKGVKREIMVLQDELESMKGILEDLSKDSADQLEETDRMWSRDVKQQSYDLESCIDRFMVRCKRDEAAKNHGLKKVIDGSISWLRQSIVRYKFAAQVRDVMRGVLMVNGKRYRYKVDQGLDKPVAVDPRIFSLYENQTKLVGIDTARDDLIKIMTEGNEASMQQGKVVCIVGPGGMGKTTLAHVVYKKLKTRFDCCAFVSVSQTPNLTEVFNGLLRQLDEKIDGKALILHARPLFHILRELLHNKRYLIVIDDIWDIRVWETIRFALPQNNCGYGIITTTRILDIAKHVGGAYKMRSLSFSDSKRLLYTRIFGSEYEDTKEYKEKWLSEELSEVSDRILVKCAGVPLAIITIASLLASIPRNKMEWCEVYNSIGTGHENNLDMNNMRKIMSLSYYNLPSHLRTCLLYLNVFPNEYKIGKAHLIWMWIAEGFILCESQKEGLFELGESYFNELINRGMIQPIYNYGMIEHCCVQEMVLDLIRSLSSEENFVTILNDEFHTSSSVRVRRLSLQNGKEDRSTIQANRIIMQQVRSVIVFPSAVDRMPALGSLRDLCVLDLNDCDLSQGCILKYLGNLFHLRYLGLSNTCITQLPEEVGNLQFLQTLSVTCNEIANLPSTVVRLRHLMCLRIDMDTRVPNGIANLKSLEELSQIGIYKSTDIESLSFLTELRVLDISCHIECMDSLEKSLVERLCKLPKVQNLNIIVTSGECKLDGLVLSQNLRRLSLRGCWFSTLPAWVNPSLLHLSFISIAVIELKEENLEILGRLRALCYLNLKVDHENLGIIRRFIIGASFFPCLVGCVLWGFRGPMEFHQGAMPRLASFRFTLHAQDMREISGSSNGGYDFGLQNLPSLQDVTVLFRCGGTSDKEVKEVKAALRHVTKIHPNHPTIDIVGYEDKDE